MPTHPPLEEMVAEASRALVRLDAVRLEELALACEALRGDLSIAPMVQRIDWCRESHSAMRNLHCFARILSATSENLSVLANVREKREDPLEYGCRRPRG